MARIPVKRIERLIYPVSFYRHKARHVKETCQILVERHQAAGSRHYGRATGAAGRRAENR